MENNIALNKTQLEILRMFSRELSDQELLELKRTFVKFLARKIEVLSNKVWDENNWSQAKMEELSNSHFRKSSAK